VRKLHEIARIGGSGRSSPGKWWTVAVLGWNPSEGGASGSQKRLVRARGAVGKGGGAQSKFTENFQNLGF
jgi:hypothetical protein